MSESSYPSANTKAFEEKYWRFRSEAVVEVMRSVFGEALATGYTTPDQARRLGSELRVDAASTLLDLGAGRGWPGALISKETGCALVSTDLPLEALRPGKRALDAFGLPRSPTVVSCDARALPFGSARFEAVSHADVLC